MSTLRTTTIPIDHVVAEMTAFPLASEAAFRGGVVELDAKLGGATGDLWRAAEAEIGRACPGFSIDELVAVRDRAWFDSGADDDEDNEYNAEDDRGNKDKKLPLHEYLREHVAQKNLEMYGVEARPRIKPTDAAPDARARQRWRWLSFALPDVSRMLPCKSDGTGAGGLASSSLS